jgi:carboxypeptidase PM20D1
MKIGTVALGIALTLATAASASPRAGSAQAETQTLDLARQLIAIRSVMGEGNRTADALQVVKGALVAGGWQDSQVEIVPFRDTAYLIATWPGSDPALKPLVISGHMDVVEANPADWQRDPFTPVVENGYLFGRGASDMKFDAALATSSLIDLRRTGLRPRRTVILQFSGDEETTMRSSRVIADRLRNAELVINIDGGGGTLDEGTGRALYWTWQGAEKTYNDYQQCDCPAFRSDCARGCLPFHPRTQPDHQGLF